MQENALYLEWSELYSLNETQNSVHQGFIAYKYLKEKFGESILSGIPTYNNLTLYFNAEQISAQEIFGFCQNIDFKISAQGSSPLLRVPFCVAEEFSLDLENLCKTTHLTREEFIQLFCSQVLEVSFLGFLPGFAYMNNLDPRLHFNRLIQPRTRVPQGSVALAAGQASIYPQESPGGWQIIGRSPIKLFYPGETNCTLFLPGDQVQFELISKDEFLAIQNHPLSRDSQRQVLGG